jgi:uncharacterized protein YraI
MKKIFYSILLFSLIASACGPSTEEVAATMAAETVQAQRETDSVEQSIQDTVEAAEAAYTQTPTFTLTLTPMPAFTETPIPSPTTIPVAEVTVEEAVIRDGPGTAYLVLDTAHQGDTFEIIGRSADNSWLVIMLEDGQGWINVSDVKANTDISNLLVMETPPTPIYTPVVKTSFWITIINQYDKEIYYSFYASEGTINKHGRIPIGMQDSFELAGGRYKFHAGAKNYNCTGGGTFELNHDIYWIVTDPCNHPFH